MRPALGRTMFVVLIMVLATGAVMAEDGENKLSWLEKMTINGDFRLRYEGFSQDGNYDDGSRDRFRYRLRLGFGFDIRDDLKIGVQLRSGTATDPVSDNQSFDGGWTKKDLAIAEAFVDWRANDHISVIAGKFSPKNLWTVSDMQWDDDVVAEGAMERFHWDGTGDIFKNFEASAYQFIMDEDSSSSDGYMFGAQIRPAFNISDKNELTVGAGFDSWSRPQEVASLTAAGTLEGNELTNLVDAEGNLISDFKVANLFAIWKNKSSKKWPVQVSLFMYKNTGAGSATGIDNTVSEGTGEGTGDDNDTAFFARVQVGDYKKPGQVAVRVSRYDSEPDALFYAFTQSDTTRSSNVDGNRVDVRVGMPARGYVNVTWYNTKATLGETATMDRWQVDYIFRF